MSPSSRASADSSGSCRLYFTLRGLMAGGDVPSTQAAFAITSRQRATCSAVSTSGMCTIMADFGLSSAAR